MCYSYHKDSNSVSVHTLHEVLWLPQIPELGQYLLSIFNGILRSHQTFFYFMEDSTGYQWRAKNYDTVYYAFNYLFYPLEDSLYINYETDSSGVVEDYHTIIEQLDNEAFIFQNEYREHRFERLTMANVSAHEKRPFIKPDKVMKKPSGPIIQVEN